MEPSKKGLGDCSFFSSRKNTGMLLDPLVHETPEVLPDSLALTVIDPVQSARHFSLLERQQEVPDWESPCFFGEAFDDAIEFS